MYVLFICQWNYIAQKLLGPLFKYLYTSLVLSLSECAVIYINKNFLPIENYWKIETPALIV
jgi:hypothetical protein